MKIGENFSENFKLYICILRYKFKGCAIPNSMENYKINIIKINKIH